MTEQEPDGRIHIHRAELMTNEKFIEYMTIKKPSKEMTDLEIIQNYCKKNGIIYSQNMIYHKELLEVILDARAEGIKQGRAEMETEMMFIIKKVLNDLGFESKLWTMNDVIIQIRNEVSKDE